MKKLIVISIILALAVCAYAGTTQRTNDNAAYHYTATIADGENGATVAIPSFDPWRPVTVTIVAGANTGKVQVTTSSEAAVTGATCTWADWDNGDSTGTTTDVIVGPVTGIRGVSVSGEVTIEIVY